MTRLIDLKHVNEYELWMKFNDGKTKIINFRNLIGEGISSELLNIEYFKLARIDDGGGLEWPNGFDFCPIYLSETMNSKIVSETD